MSVVWRSELWHRVFICSTAKEIQAKLARDDAELEPRALATDATRADAELIGELYLSTFSRLPTEAEIARQRLEFISMQNEVALSFIGRLS